MKRFSILFLFMLVSPNFIFADDSVASIKAGGIVLETTNGISLDKEILTISTKKILVHLEFTNRTNKDITTLVAFPVPDIEISEGSDGSINMDSPNPMNFLVAVDGKKQVVKFEKKQLTTNQDPNLYSLKYYWEQTFPKKKTLLIEHDYVPAIGSTGTHGEAMSSEIKEYCIDSGTNESIKKLFVYKQAALTNLWYWDTVDYTLKTGANWKGPIGSFELIIDKEVAKNIISLCFDGDLKKISPTQFSLSQKNYEPKQDLHILYIKPTKIPD